MCIAPEIELDIYGFCFDYFRYDLGQGWDQTIQAYLLDKGVIVNDEAEFGRRFLDLLEQAHKDGLISPVQERRP